MKATTTGSDPSAEPSLKSVAVRTFICMFGFVICFLPFFQGHAEDTSDKAWSVLQTGLQQKGDDKATAVRALGLIEKDSKAEQLALTALGDENADVRAAAADALGQMQAKSSTKQLESTLKSEQDVGVIIACARSMVALGDPMGYAVYYAILTGEKKSGESLLDSQKKMLKDPKKMAELGIGFVPFGGLGLTALKMVTRDDTSPVRGAAARVLAKDPDPKSGEALVQATSDKSWIVRAAALDALSHRGDPSVIPKIEASLDDDKSAVRSMGAAAIIHLSEVQAQKPVRKHK